MGEINVKGFSLGVGAVLFVALAMGWFAPKSVPSAMVGTLGLALFLYGVGVQYGTQFFIALNEPRRALGEHDRADRRAGSRCGEPRPHEDDGQFAASSEGPLTTVGSLMRLAHMFRFGWIELTARDVVNRRPDEIDEIARDMRRRLSSITAESFNKGIRTEQAVLLAFDDGSPLQLEVKKAMQAWKSTVEPQLDRSLRDRDTDGLLEALREASKVNWQFHRACAQRYCDIVTKHWQDAST